MNAERDAYNEHVLAVAMSMLASENPRSGWTWDDASPIEREGWLSLAEVAIRELCNIGYLPPIPESLVKFGRRPGTLASQEDNKPA